MKIQALTFGTVVSMVMASATWLGGVNAQFPSGPTTSCPSYNVRQEWRQMTSSQQSAYLNAVNQLKNRPAGPSGNPAQWNHDQFVNSHLQMASMNHATPAFLPWHRAFVSAYESALQSIDSSVTSAYWDWTLDSNNIFSAPVFNADSLGGNGNPKNSSCVLDGVVKGWVLGIRETQMGSMCLQRDFQNSLGTTPDRSLMDNKYYPVPGGYDGFRTKIEGIHNNVHMAISGDMAPLSSPNDPIFFMHHSFVDKMWAKWQSLCPENQNDYGARDISHELMPFPATVADVMKVGSKGNCFQYTLDPNDGPVKVQCKAQPGPTTSAVAPSPVVTVIGTQIVTMTVPRPSATSTSAAAPSPTLAPPSISLANFSMMMDTSAALWLQNELQALLIPGILVPTKPVTADILKKAARNPSSASMPLSFLGMNATAPILIKRSAGRGIPSEVEMKATCSKWSYVATAEDKKFSRHMPHITPELCAKMRMPPCNYERALQQELEDNAFIDFENCKRYHGWAEEYSAGWA